MSDSKHMNTIGFNDSLNSNHKLWGTFWIFLVAGAFFTLVNLGWPIARNALCYAKAALGIIQHNFNLFAIARDHAWTSGKPIFFSALAALFVKLFGVNAGTIVASAIGTAFFLWTVALAIPRLNKRSGLDASLMPFEFVLVACNPLVIYQFWSAYPDSLFAGLVVLAFVLTDVIATEPERDLRPHILGLGVTIYIAIHTKLYGAVLLILCPLYSAMHARERIRSRHRTAHIGILAAVFGVVGLTLVAAKLNLNPLLDFAEGGGATDYVGGILGARIQVVFYSICMLSFAGLLTFQAALLFLCTPAAWRALAAKPTLFATIYILGLLTFPGTTYNMRYFLPAFPFFAIALAAGARSARPVVRRTILSAYGAIALALVLSFNLAPVEETVHPLLSSLSGWCAPLEGWLDNLRLSTHIALKRQIDEANAKVPLGSVFYWSSDYYGTATHGLAEHLGVKKGLDIRYVLDPAGIKAPAGPVFLTVFTSTAPPWLPWQAPDWATVKTVGYGLFRLDPISVDVQSLSGDYVRLGSVIRLRARVTAGAQMQIKKVEFIDGESLLGSDQQPPFELTWRGPNSGRHEIVTRVTYGENCVLFSESVIYVGIPLLERTAGTRSDLAFEMLDGSVWPADDTLAMTGNESAIGIRFEKLNVPKRAQIAHAYLELTAARPESQPTTLEIHGELSANAAVLKFEKGDLGRRERTVASVNWLARPWTFVGERDRSPNLAHVLEEIFSAPGWQPGGAIVLFIRCSGPRVIQSTGDYRRGAPTLYVQLKEK